MTAYAIAIVQINTEQPNDVQVIETLVQKPDLSDIQADVIRLHRAMDSYMVIMDSRAVINQFYSDAFMGQTQHIGQTLLFVLIHFETQILEYIRQLIVNEEEPNKILKFQKNAIWKGIKEALRTILNFVKSSVVTDKAVFEAGAQNLQANRQWYAQTLLEISHNLENVLLPTAQDPDKMQAVFEQINETISQLHEQHS